ncbi:MAG: tetratricopeptide repeat protein, partial [Streptomyces sp.]
MGGVGKTQLAADHARRAWREAQVDLLVWVTAATRQAIVDAYAQAAVDILCADPAQPDAAVTQFLAWLEPKPRAEQPRWLIVLDDVADPGDLQGLWPPNHAQGRIVVTTRRRDAALATHGQLTPVGLFTQAEAIAYLDQALAPQGRSAPPAVLAALADDLGLLPLALSQAAAYLADSGLSAAAYRTHLADRARHLRDLLPEPRFLPDDQQATVAAAWSLSLDYADRLRPVGLARPMLQLASMLDPNGIPRTVLTSPPALAHLTAHRTTPGGGDDPDVTAEEASNALTALHRLSLIDHTPQNPQQAVRVHQLIQRATRDPLTPDQRDELARTTGDALMSAWPETERDTQLAQALRANAAALTASAEDALHRPDAHTVLYRLGHSLGEAGQAASAREHFHHLTDTTTRHLGPDHPDTLATRSNLAYWRGEAGNVDGAARAFAELLEDELRVLGPDHPDILATRSTLARWRGEAGDVHGAARALAELLEDRLRVLGPDHPDTLATRSDLALLRWKAGDVDGAARALAELLEDRLRVLGPDHPYTLTTRNNL